MKKQSNNSILQIYIRMKIKFLIYFIVPVICFWVFSCKSESSKNDNDLLTTGDVVKAYSSKNYKLIAIEAQIRYSSQFFRWKKGTTPNWIGSSHERLVALDLKDIFDSTANFQLIDSKNNERNNQEKSNCRTFSFVKLNRSDSIDHIFFEGSYRNQKDGDFMNKNASKFYFPLIFPTKYRLKFNQDTLDIMYDNTKSYLGAESLAFRLILSK
jgi:hypothetical protein